MLESGEDHGEATPAYSILCYNDSRDFNFWKRILSKEIDLVRFMKDTGTTWDILCGQTQTRQERDLVVRCGNDDAKVLKEKKKLDAKASRARKTYQLLFKKTIQMVSNSHRCLILGNKVLIVIVLSTLLGLLSACTGSDSPYDSVEHFGKENIVRTSLVFQTSRLDAQYTSLSGQWHMKDSLLCFVDEYAVGIKEYDLSGHFMGAYPPRKGPEKSWPPLLSRRPTSPREISSCRTRTVSSIGSRKTIKTVLIEPGLVHRAESELWRCWKQRLV